MWSIGGGGGLGDEAPAFARFIAEGGGSNGSWVEQEGGAGRCIESFFALLSNHSFAGSGLALSGRDGGVRGR
jgi:hypothetical protein